MPPRSASACRRQEADIDITEAQADLSDAYFLGSSGVLVSGLVWLASAIVWTQMGATQGFTTLFVGGMAIFPLSMIIARVGGAPAAAKANPLNRLGFETTVPLFAGLLIALRILPSDPALAFALFAIIVGARYFAFATLYGDRIYWLLGGAVAAIGAGFMLHRDRLPLTVAAWIAATELVFAAILFIRWRRQHR